jgi:hypothetical protein
MNTLCYVVCHLLNGVLYIHSTLDKLYTRTRPEPHSPTRRLCVRELMSSARLTRRVVSNVLAARGVFPAMTRTVTSSATSATSPCWSCDAERVTVRPGEAYDFFCASCGAIQPAPSSSSPTAGGVDYFQLLGVYVCARVACVEAND